MEKKIEFKQDTEFKSDFKIILNLSNYPAGIYYLINGKDKVKVIRN